jgi:hypothetical protein
MDDLEIARLAVESFSARDESLLPACSYLLPELRLLQTCDSDFLTFEECISQINPSGSVHDAALILGHCQRIPSPTTPTSLIQTLRLLCDVESRIRFSLWPGGTGAPHHFSKLLNTQRVRSLFFRQEILAILAIFDDPKGLNLRNTTAHGFSIDCSLTSALLNGISNLVFPKLSGYSPPEFDFSRELSLFQFHKFRLTFSDLLHDAGATRFCRFDRFRM